MLLARAKAGRDTRNVLVQQLTARISALSEAVRDSIRGRLEIDVLATYGVQFRYTVNGRHLRDVDMSSVVNEKTSGFSLRNVLAVGPKLGVFGSRLSSVERPVGLSTEQGSPLGAVVN